MRQRHSVLVRALSERWLGAYFGFHAQKEKTRLRLRAPRRKKKLRGSPAFCVPKMQAAL